METWDSYCPNCFSEKTDGKQQCHSCGYDEGESRSPAALPLRMILNNQYVVGRVLGNPGGFGITYLCWDTILRTRVAIKEFMPRDNAVRDKDQYSVVAHSGKDQEFFEYGLKAFLAEARTVAGFDHPNIVRVRTYFEQNHTAYLVMDYYEGVSLAEYVRQKGGRLLEKAALGIMGFVLDGLRHVHEKGYLHRDVKPANIYLTSKGQVILLDFGAARYAMGEHSRSLSVVVTPGFSPFEQYSTNGKQGPWTDIYASGATLYYMLTGKPPKSAPNRVLSDTLAEPGQLLPDLPPGANKGIIQALRVKASDRLQSIEEFKKILSGSSQPVPAVSIQKTEEKSDREEKREEIKKPVIPIWNKKKGAIAIGICLLVFLTIVYGDWWRTGVLVVDTYPEDAEVMVDGVYQGRGRLRLDKVSSGERTVSAKLPGYGGEPKTVEVTSGQVATVYIRLVAMQWTLKIVTEPSGAEVSVNGIGNGITPIYVAGLSSGTVKVRGSREGYVMREEPVEVVVGDIRQVEWDMQKAMGVLRVVTEPSGVEISVNGVVKGKSPVEVTGLSSGTVKVRASREGYVMREEPVDVVVGAKRQVKLDMQRTVVLRVVTEPSGAEISVNGVVMGKSPVAVMDIKPGYAKIRASTNTKGYAVREEVVNVEVGRERVLEWKLTQLVEQDLTPAGPKLTRAGPKIGDVWKDPVTEMEFVWVTGGCYQMGCGSWDGNCRSDEKPVHEVCVDGFWIGQTEVTQGQWLRVMESNPSHFKKGGNYPVEQVSWEDAKKYIRKLNEMGSGKFRLPSEAEWEYAARSGGKAEKYSGGSDVNSVAWHVSNSGGSTHPVKIKTGNRLGIYDMTGNVCEWCEDVYAGAESFRVFRGGSWYSGPDDLRCAYRDSDDQARRSGQVGFRLLRM